MSCDEYVEHMCASYGPPDDAVDVDMPSCIGPSADIGVQVTSDDSCYECEMAFLEDKLEILRYELDAALALHLSFAIVSVEVAGGNDDIDQLYLVEENAK